MFGRPGLQQGAARLVRPPRPARGLGQQLIGALGRAQAAAKGQSGPQVGALIHQARVEAGVASVIFGLQSFGEGLDLPGLLCETVFIAKLPFSPPSDPVEEARAEWLKRAGRDPFNELVVPPASNCCNGPAARSAPRPTRPG